MAAYSLSGLPIKKLTFYYEETVEDDDEEDDNDDDDDCYEDNEVEDEEDDDCDDHYFSSDDEIQYAKAGMVYQLEELLSSPSACHVEELYFGIDYYWGTYRDDIATLPSSKALRVLHITNCSDMDGLPDVVDFPQLTELRLHLCHVSREILQAIIDASPLLTTLQLDGGSLFWYPESQHSLSLPKVTALLIEIFDYVGNHGQGNMELDAPNLRYFTYKGPVPALSLKSPVPHMTQVELQFDVSDVHRNSQSKDVACHLFWKLLSNFCSAKMLMLSFEPPDHYAPDDV